MHDDIDGRYKKGKERVIILFFFEKSCRFVEIACSDSVRRLYGLCALPCKRLCVEYKTFARKANYFVHTVRLLCVSDLLHTYTTCALEATCTYDVRLCAYSDLMRTYRTAFARK